MADGVHLSLRIIDAIEGRLRPLVGPRVLRVVYQLGYPVLRVWWLAARPRVTGVKAVVRCGEQVLLVRHTYGKAGRWDVPGGFLRGGEQTDETMRRELAEELGVEPVSARVIARTASRHDHKRETRVTYVADLADTEVHPSAAEIAEARWFPRDALPGAATAFARQMIARAYWDPRLLARPAAAG